jgi:hypothetical protein
MVFNSHQYFFPQLIVKFMITIMRIKTISLQCKHSLVIKKELMYYGDLADVFEILNKYLRFSLYDYHSLKLIKYILCTFRVFLNFVMIIEIFCLYLFRYKILALVCCISLLNFDRFSFTICL